MFGKGKGNNKAKEKAALQQQQQQQQQQQPTPVSSSHQCESLYNNTGGELYYHYEKVGVAESATYSVATSNGGGYDDAGPGSHKYLDLMVRIFIQFSLLFDQ